MSWNRIGKVLSALVVIVVVAVVITFVSMMRSGISARVAPGGAEGLVARAARHLATPSRMRNARNPLVPSPQLLEDGRAHWADHCAVCHGNDGKGKSALGASMAPRTPDMTLPATQSLSDGELFSIIENGVRLTGMPAFGDGTARSATDSWKLVLFIRHLPQLSAAEIMEMEKLNPKTPEEWRRLEEEEEFLGERASPPAADGRPARP
jgi:mono/diheme cytochrome c family protein